GRVFPVDVTDAGDGVVEVTLGQTVLTSAHRGQGSSVLPQDAIALGAMRDGFGAIHEGVTGQAECWLLGARATRHRHQRQAEEGEEGEPSEPPWLSPTHG